MVAGLAEPTSKTDGQVLMPALKAMIFLPFITSGVC